MAESPQVKREKISRLRNEISQVRVARERSAKENSRRAIDDLLDAEIANLEGQLREERRIAALQVVGIEGGGAEGASPNRPSESGRPAEEDPAV